MLTFGRARSLDRLRKSRTTQKPRNPQRKVLNVFVGAVLIAGAAHKHRLRVFAHVYAESDVRHALEAGIDVLTHAGPAGTAPPYSKELITGALGRRAPL